MKGPSSWEGRPRDIRTYRVSELPEDLKRLFKQLIGARRWCTDFEIEQLQRLMYYKKEGKHGLHH